MNNIDNSISCTNTYIFLKKSGTECVESTRDSQEVFRLVQPLSFSNRVKHIKINLCVNKMVDNCCDNLVVFSDVIDFDQCNLNTTFDSNKSENILWYQSKDLIQGFKDCYINKISASELW